MRGAGGADRQTDRQTPLAVQTDPRARLGQGQTLQAVVELPLSVCPCTLRVLRRCLALGDDGTQLAGAGHPWLGAPAFNRTPPSTHALCPPVNAHSLQ